ncbi:hypothetical protein FQN54_005206 [Arachnomyces sp. PD_36]|nr:hypothetical protein FQN54_005206 [Arachnomyces sp. PD_36]
MDVFELSTGTADTACGQSDVVLNGHDLTQSWDGSSGAGSGLISAELLNGRSQDLVANWQSLYISPTTDSPTEDERPAQVLTLQIHQIDRDEVDQAAGFTISFRQLDGPEILRLDTSPLSISDDHDQSLELESWRVPPPLSRLRVQTIASFQPTGNTMEEILEAEVEELQELQFRAHELKQLVAQKEDKIRKLLQQDCSSISSQVGQCDSVGCVFQTCVSAVPEMISRLRCRFGSLDSCLSRKPSLGCGGQDSVSGSGGTDSEQPLQNSHSHNTSDGTGTYTDDPYDGVDTESSSSSPSPGGNQSYTDDYFHFNRSYFALFFVVILSYCLLRRCVLVCRSPRRRVDCAARREERRNRHAYRCAARRHQWNQWWSGGQQRNHESSPSDDSNYDLERGGNEASRRQSTSDASSIFEEGAMQAEILGLRRALEFVGELVRPEDVGYPHQLRRFPRHVYDRAGSPSARPRPIATPASSTAMLTTISSPRTSSLMSCDDTGSSVTLETLDTDPPEYRK